MLESLSFIEKRVIRLGAEALIKEALWKTFKIVMKHRIPKRYRTPVIDERVRRSRTLHESKILMFLSNNGLPVPLVYFIDLRNSIIYMQFIEGTELRNHPHAVEKAETLGRITGRMHSFDVAHGDLTLANIIADNGEGVWLVDFGLSSFNADLEEKAIDIHLLERSAVSTFPKKAPDFMESFFKGYSSEVGPKKTEEVLEKVREIRSRGRYVARG